MVAEIEWAIQFVDEKVNALFDELGRDDPETKNMRRLESILKRIESHHSYDFGDIELGDAA